MIFKGRVPTGEIATPGGDEDLVLSRILWLEGLDANNNNTRDRYIYIHGTNQEDLIGTPASHGCIRLCNQDMIELYGRIPNHTEVFIRP
jgi:lipoprotein-anchoring transpeptidase ErfK/SrfK